MWLTSVWFPDGEKTGEEKREETRTTYAMEAKEKTEAADVKRGANLSLTPVTVCCSKKNKPSFLNKFTP